MKEKLENLIKEALKSLGLEAGDFVVEHPSDLKMGDYSTNVGIKTGKAKEILAHLDTPCPSGVERVELAGPGFINFYFSKDFFKKSLEEIIEKGDEFGKNENLKGKKFFVEHTQPNIFKEFHIGHLMNNTIGESISRIIKMNGAEVKTASYHGDIGLHVAKAVWAILKNHTGNSYVIGNKAYEEDGGAKIEIQEINKKIYERSDEKINKIYDSGRKESLRRFESIYQRLNTNFDYSFFESESGELGRELVLEFLKKGIFEKSEGAVVFKGEKFGLHTRVFLNSEGLPTYEAKEVGLVKIKKETYPFDQSITITANEQDAFFKVVEIAAGEVFSELKGKLKHLSHGVLRLPTGKMSSRTGDVITAEQLIEEVKKRVKDNEAVAIGAIKYMILRQAIGNDIIFDIERSVSTEGDSGVYLQYAYARTNSLLEKANAQGLTLGSETLRNTHEVERLLYRFPEVVEKAGKEYAPHYIVTYLTELAGSFNNFYAHEQIIDDSPESPYRLAIAKAFNIVMKNGLTVLGIPTPERI
ncbi:MAG: Arginine-tRNA ligase [Candidatus Nomurabacteria bacterium GW2011_GWA1_46_11]|uniref:Arginine--tRNA ligase n=1 Tax=Candidatus Nomurabacteria bacterium GW2011_GWA1_46_11 TaxID=1618732 RepID=A0A0G1NL13_9BACT|nr:MAG: Arginine-tRNA ligase [Candidatus Nomurabacteria bacterium GW2011_GWA1_46_11]